MSIFNIPQSFNAQGKLVSLHEPIVMGIVNVTHNSFYAKSRVQDSKAIKQRVEQILTEGAKIIDVGAYSSRPGAEDISAEQEWERLKQVLDIIRENYPDVLVSVDTFRADVLEKAIQQYNINIVNDISGGNLDENMFSVVGQYKMPYILMHMQGTPQTMQNNPQYTDVVKDMLIYFAEKKEKLISLGVKDIILDPGFGFAKTTEHNFQILNRLNEFDILELPMLIGVSRKSMIFKTLDITPDESLNGTTVLNTISLIKGAKILRVHDVKEAVEAVCLYQKMIGVSC